MRYVLVVFLFCVAGVSAQVPGVGGLSVTAVYDDDNRLENNRPAGSVQLCVVSADGDTVISGRQIFPDHTVSRWGLAFTR